MSREDDQRIEGSTHGQRDNKGVQARWRTGYDVRLDIFRQAFEQAGRGFLQGRGFRGHRDYPTEPATI